MSFGVLVPCARLEVPPERSRWPSGVLSPVQNAGLALWWGLEWHFGVLAPSARGWGSSGGWHFGCTAGLEGALGLCAAPLGVLAPKAMSKGHSYLLGFSLGLPCWWSPLLPTPQFPGVLVPPITCSAPF